MKYLLTNANLLNIADPNKDFLRCTDACKEVLRGVLMQEGYVICYESKKLNKHEINYVTHNLELVFIDDILIYSKRMDEHEEKLKLVLQVVREHKLYVKLSKCDFFQKQLHS